MDCGLYSVKDFRAPSLKSDILFSGGERWLRLLRGLPGRDRDEHRVLPPPVPLYGGGGPQTGGGAGGGGGEGEARGGDCPGGLDWLDWLELHRARKADSARVGPAGPRHLPALSALPELQPGLGRPQAGHRLHCLPGASPVEGGGGQETLPGGKIR